jgi:type IV pilus assembly protein PilW
MRYTSVKKALVKGFSLVELVIALALGSVVTAGVVQLFVANSETHNLLVGQSRMQESARFALDFIGRQVRQAGYRGCFAAGDEPFSTIQPATNIPYEFDIRTGIQGFNATGLNAWAPALNVLPNAAADSVMNDPTNTVFKTTYGYGTGGGINIDQIVSGTDVVTVRYVSKVEAGIGGYTLPGGAIQYDDPQSAADPLVVGVEVGWAEFDLDHIVAVHDCEQTSIFRVTTANPWGRNADGSPAPAPAPAAGAETTDLEVGHDINDVDPTRNSDARLTDADPYDRSGFVSAIESHTFFIAPGEGINNLGNTPLSLWRKSGFEPPLELVEGVEDLQFLYGADLDGSGAPNQYLQANFVADWGQIVTVRVTVVVNSVDSVGGTTVPSQGCAVQDCVTGKNFDGLIRRSFSQTILLRN